MIGLSRYYAAFNGRPNNRQIIGLKTAFSGRLSDDDFSGKFETKFAIYLIDRPRLFDGVITRAANLVRLPFFVFDLDGKISKVE